MKTKVSRLFPGSNLMTRKFIIRDIEWMKGPQPGKTIQCDGYTITAAADNPKKK